ncbi:hypothetical protein ACFQ9R_21585 [Nocardia sp. NPDC056541]|uniref:hypothetical protein n=1 Tax=Nocardia sp. NPDC056541 TaxID=3345860 RepID=UPI00366BDF86
MSRGAAQSGVAGEAVDAPVWHLRRTVDGGLFDTYTDSFNAVWRTGRPVKG